MTTYFKDRRSGTVYTTREKTLPTSGSIPLKAAYREDTVWIDRNYLETVKNPHQPSVWHTFWTLLVLVLWVGLWIFSSNSMANENHVSFADALFWQGGWSLVGCSLTLRWSGLVHG
jgi:hypothetical protein